MRSRQTLKRCVATVRLVPFAMSVALLFHLILYAFGLDLNFISFISGSGIMSGIFMLCISSSFGLCLAHKTLIIYTITAGLGRMLNQNGFLGSYENAVLYFLICLGVVVLGYAIFNRLRYERSSRNRSVRNTRQA